MKNTLLGGVIFSALLLIQACNAETEQNVEERAAINEVLDGFHDAAAKADKTRYLGYFSAGAVFMGTDDWERWPLPEFEKYVAKRFAGGAGWRYRSLERHIAFAAAGDTAWFDEIALSEKWGRFRGTGVMIKEGEEWKVAHYSLTVLVPNEAWEQTLSVTKPAFEARDSQ